MTDVSSELTWITYKIDMNYVQNRHKSCRFFLRDKPRCDWFRRCRMTWPIEGWTGSVRKGWLR